MINKQAITTAIEYHCEDIKESGDFEEHYQDSDITAENILMRAKEALASCLEGHELLNINLTDSALKAQENEIINFINQN